MLYNPITVGARRYHGTVPLKPPFTDTELIWGGSLRQTLIPMFSGNKQIEMGRYSFVTALERGDDQNWHKDVDEPYRDFVGTAAFEDITPAGAGEAVDPLHAAFPLPPQNRPPPRSLSRSRRPQGGFGGSPPDSPRFCPLLPQKSISLGCSLLPHFRRRRA